MATETVDPIDWLFLRPNTGQYPLRLTYCTVQCELQITRLAVTCEDRTRDLRNASPTHCICAATQGIWCRASCCTWWISDTRRAKPCFVLYAVNIRYPWRVNTVLRAMRWISVTRRVNTVLRAIRGGYQIPGLWIPCFVLYAVNILYLDGECCASC